MSRKCEEQGALIAADAAVREAVVIARIQIGVSQTLVTRQPIRNFFALHEGRG